MVHQPNTSAISRCPWGVPPKALGVPNANLKARALPLLRSAAAKAKEETPDTEPNLAPDLNFSAGDGDDFREWGAGVGRGGG